MPFLQPYQSITVDVPSTEKIAIGAYFNSNVRVQKLVGLYLQNAAWEDVTTVDETYLSAAFTNGATLAIYNGTGICEYEIGAAPILTQNVTNLGLNFGIPALTDASTIAWDVSLAPVAKVTLTGSNTLGNPTNMQIGKTYEIEVIQDAAGSRTISFDSLYSFGSVTPTFATAGTQKNLIRCFWDGEILMATLVWKTA